MKPRHVLKSSFLLNMSHQFLPVFSPKYFSDPSTHASLMCHPLHSISPVCCYGFLTGLPAASLPPSNLFSTQPQNNLFQTQMCLCHCQKNKVPVPKCNLCRVILPLGYSSASIFSFHTSIHWLVVFLVSVCHRLVHLVSFWALIMHQALFFALKTQ